MLGLGASWDPDTDIPDLTGKIALVTGGKSVFPVTKGYCEYRH